MRSGDRSRVEPGPAPSTPRRLLRLAAVVAVFAAGLANWRQPALRFAWQPLNHFAFLGVLALPLVAIAFAVRLRPRWVRWPVAVALLPVAAGAAVLAMFTTWMLADTLRTGDDPSFTHVRDVPAASHSTLRVYRTNGGATTAYGAVVRQERTLVPGLRLVRDVYRAYPAEDVRIEVDSLGRASFDGRPPVPLDPRVWF